jgi:uncharacterized repeat protein (TIGR03843 family)
MNIPKVVEQLRQGIMVETHGHLPWGSNFTLLVQLSSNSDDLLAIYKPRRGERPLWDFPDGSLCRREVAAFEVSEAVGWHIVPPTVLRDGPYGLGMVQAFIDHDPNQHYFTFGEDQKQQLRRIALFDHLINNADRKGGHCLLDSSGRLWAIDHGISFHEMSKLRTVIWEFAGQPISPDLLHDLECFVEMLAGQTEDSVIGQLLSATEVAALRDRGRALLHTSSYPVPSAGRQYPWPPV